MGKKSVSSGAKRNLEAQSKKLKKSSASSNGIQKSTKHSTSKPNQFNVQTHPFVKKLADNGKFININV